MCHFYHRLSEQERRRYAAIEAWQSGNEYGGKKQELIGNFHRAGTLQTLEPVRVNDHDFEALADGKVIPHGLDDLYQNLGSVTLGTHYDTSEFACTGIRNWWLNHGQFDYPKASSILIRGG